MGPLVLGIRAKVSKTEREGEKERLKKYKGEERLKTVKRWRTRENSGAQLLTEMTGQKLLAWGFVKKILGSCHK